MSLTELYYARNERQVGSMLTCTGAQPVPSFETLLCAAKAHVGSLSKLIVVGHTWSRKFATVCIGSRRMARF